MDYDREWLRNYFTYDWPGTRTAGLDGYYWTGFKLIEEIKENETVLDVGCGINPFSRHLDHLVGIDITDIGADIPNTAIEEWDSVGKRLFDVAFCLGSINFGDAEIIDKQIDAITKCLVPNSRIYWRVNPSNRDHENPKVNEIPFFHWSLDWMMHFAKKYKYDITEWMPDRNRWYCKWERLDGLKNTI